MSALATPPAADAAPSSSWRPTVIVVGGGLAGLSASAEAVMRGANVILIDKEASIGGNSAKATSGINGAETRGQKLAHITDTPAQHANDTLISGRGLCDDALVRILTGSAAQSIAFLESTGIDLSLLSQCGGHSAPRTHREPNTSDGKPRPVGFDIVQSVRKFLETTAPKGQFTVKTKTRMVDLVMKPTATTTTTTTTTTETTTTTNTTDATASSSTVAGVMYVEGDSDEYKTMFADAVILTTGGYSADTHGLLVTHAPQLAGLPTTNGYFATGDGVKIASRHGAVPRDMDKVQVHPTAFIDPKDPQSHVKFLGPEALRGCGGILITRTGHRFVNELAPRDTVTGAMYKYASLNERFYGFQDTEQAVAAGALAHSEQPREAEALLVLDDEAVTNFGKAAFGFYHRAKGFFTQVDGAAGLAQYLAVLDPNANAIGDSPVADAVRIALADAAGTAVDATMPVAGPLVTATTHQTLVALIAAANKSQPDFVGRTVFASKFSNALTGPLYVARITGAIHYTMGGIAIDGSARVRRRHVVVVSDDSDSNAVEEEDGYCTVKNGEEKCTSTATTTTTKGNTITSADNNKSKKTKSDDVILGLYAAGEVTGGVHGANRLAGNSLLECVVFGRIAAVQAVEYAHQHHYNDDSKE